MQEIDYFDYVCWFSLLFGLWHFLGVTSDVRCQTFLTFYRPKDGIMKVKPNLQLN